MGYPVARVGNLVKVGNTVGKIITGANAHFVDGPGGGGVSTVSNGLVTMYGALEAQAMLGPDADDGKLQTAIEEGNVVSEPTPEGEEQPVNSEAVPQNCNGITGNEPASFVLGTGFNLGHFTTNCAFANPTVIRAQNNLSKKDMVCNLRNLVQNTLIPIANHFGRDSFAINAGFRYGAGTSQHKRGMAADLQFRGKNPTQTLAIAEWIRVNIRYDQLILERGNGYWIHVSYDANRMRRMSFSIDTRPTNDINYDRLRLMP